MKEIPQFLHEAHAQYEALLTPPAVRELFELDDIGYFAQFYTLHAPLARERFLSPGHPVYQHLETMGYDDERKLIYFLTSFYAAMRLKYGKQEFVPS